MTFIIAEIGCNWHSLDEAKDLIRSAAQAGADAVKFQSFGPDFDPALKEYSLSENDHFDLYAECQAAHVTFMSTAFDDHGFECLRPLRLKYGKVPSGELTNDKYLDRCRDLFSHLFVSTGMANLSEIEHALLRLGWPGREATSDRKELTLMHCVSGYPPRIEEINLRCIRTLAEAFHLPVGLSDHSLSLTLPSVAVAMGAVAVEKHIRTSCDVKAIDAAVSLPEYEFPEMVYYIREAEQAMGDGVKRCQPSEQATLSKRNRYEATIN